jgi:flagellar biosynthesis component FlhA
MKLSKIYYHRARQKALAGLTILTFAVAANLWSLALLPTLPVTGFLLMACALVLLVWAFDWLIGALDLAKSARIERLIETSDIRL